MTDPSQTQPFDRRRPFVLIGSAAMLVISSGGIYLIVVALKEIALEFGWPRAVPSFAFSMQYIGSGFGGIIMGYALDRFGFGMPAVIGAVMVGVGGILVSYVDAAWQLFAIYGFMFGLCGQGGLSAPALANIARWYDRRRGMAVGIVSSGQAAAGILWPPVFGYLLGAWGWRDMYFWYGVFALCTMLPLCLLVRHKPPPYVPPAPAAPTPHPATARQVAAPVLSDRTIQRVFCCAIIGCCVAMSLPLAHLVALVTDLGHPIMNAVEVLAFALLAAFISRAVLLGLLSDRMGGLRALLIFSVVQASTLAALAVVQELWLLYAVAVLYGLGYGGIFPVYAVAVRDHLPVAEAGRRTGIVFLFGAAAMGFGSWMGGYLFDVTGSYTLPFVIGVAFNVVNIAIVVALMTRLKAPGARR